MVEIAITIQNDTGLHARPASDMIKIAKSFKSEITIQKGTEIANCKSIISVLSCNVSKGSSVVLRAEGEDEEVALDSLTNFLSNLKE